MDRGEVFPLDIYYYDIFKFDLGMKLRNRIIWYFGHGLHASKRFSGRYETILWFSKSDDYIFNLDPVRIPAKYPGKRHFKGDKQVILREKIPLIYGKYYLIILIAAYGIYPMSNPITQKRQIILANIQLSL